MPDTKHAQHNAARADALVTAQLAFAMNGYKWDGLPERHRQTFNRETLLRGAVTPLQRYCMQTGCEPWECLAAILNRMKRPDGTRLWGITKLAHEVFNGMVQPEFRTRDEIHAAIARRLFLPRDAHREAVRMLRNLGLIPSGDDH